jgi:hypothetical protein
MSTGLRKTYSSKASIHSALAILSKENEDGRLNNKNQRIKVVSTKISVDQLESFNLLAECMYREGLIDKPTPSTILRNGILDLLNTYRNDIENYRTLKNQSMGNIDIHHQLITRNSGYKQSPVRDPSNNNGQDDPHQYDILKLEQPQIDIASTNSSSSVSSTSVRSADHSDEPLQKQEDQAKEDTLELKEFIADRMLDFIISPYTTRANSSKDTEKEKKEPIEMSPDLAEKRDDLVQDIKIIIMHIADAFDKFCVKAKEKRFPIELLLKDREKLKEQLGIKDLLEIP